MEDEDDDMSDGNSDGQGALREIDERENPREGTLGSRGPVSKNLQHYHDPVMVTRPGQKSRWGFKCRICSRYVSYVFGIAMPHSLITNVV